MEIRTLHHGFDGLDVSFQGAASVGFLELCKAAKERAQETERDEIITYKGQSWSVARAGAPGFSYRLDTGPDGEKWFVAHSEKTHAWNIKVSVKSLALATWGYQACKERIFERLQDMGAVYLDHAIGRVDFAVDFEAPDFELKPENMVCHWRCSKGERGEAADGGWLVNWQGRRITSITVGKMPGRQVIIYDKRTEAIQRQKKYWFDIWGVDRETRVWRIEVRAGKKDLKDRWRIATFDDLEASAASVFEETLRAIRLHDSDQTDSNVTRQDLHPAWQAALCIVTGGHVFGAGVTRPEKVIEGSIEQIKDRFATLMGGLAASYSVAMIRARDARPTGEAIGEEIGAWIKTNRTKFRDSRRRAKARLRFLERDAWGSGITNRGDMLYAASG
jgi:hypothetical protein